MVQKKNQKKEVSEEKSIFLKEIERLPEEYKKKLLEKEKNFIELVDIIKKKSQGKSMGFYITPKINYTKEGQAIPDFDKITLNFLLDDFDKPVSEFLPNLLLAEDFDKYLIKEKVKNEYGEEDIIFYLKSNKNIIFNGTSISLLRENCFDSIYEDLKTLGTSFVYEDSRGFISALKSIDIHRNLLLQKFEKYVVVYAGAGSWLRGEKSNDFDVFVVVDDTDVKKMPRLQVKDQLTRIVWQMAQEVAQLTGINLHCQVYLLTDFWDALKDAHPVMFTFLRDGVPFYDRGLYTSWKELLKLGKIRPSPEAIDMHMNVANQLVDRAKKTLADVLVNDIYYAVLNPAQAILMLKGYNPTTPKETVKIFKEVLYEKEKEISLLDVKILEDTVKKFKEVEHNKDTKISGKDIDKMLKDAENFLKDMKKMFEEVTKEKVKESILSAYTELLTQIRSLNGYLDLDEENLIKSFENDYLKQGKLPSFVKKSFLQVKKAIKDFNEDKITTIEVNKALKEMRNIQAEIKEYKNSRFIKAVTNKKLILKYGKESLKTIELFNYEDKIYLNLLNEEKLYSLNDKNKFIEEKILASSLSDINKLSSILVSDILIKEIKKVIKTDVLIY